MKSLKLFMLLLSVSVMSFSCGDDDDGNQNSGDNVLVFGDTEIQLRSGLIDDFGLVFDEDGVFNFDITLLDTQIIEVDGEPIPTNETFSGVYFELFTDNSQDLEVGTYTFGNNVQVGSYEYANVIINSTLEDFNEFDINSGSFTVLDNGSTYEFEFEGTTEDGTEFSGYYKGSLLAYDSTDDADRSSGSTSNMKRRLFNNMR